MPRDRVTASVRPNLWGSTVGTTDTEPVPNDHPETHMTSPTLTWHGVPLTRTSERGNFSSCNWQWNHSYTQGLESAAPSSALVFGSAIHAALEARYRPGRERGTYAECARAFAKYMQGESSVRLTDNAGINGWSEATYEDAGLSMIKGYIDHYGDEPHINVLQPEQRFQILFRGPDGAPAFIYTGTMDGIYRDLSRGADHKLGLLEHKTAASVRTDNLHYIDQGSSYFAMAAWWAGEFGLTDGEPLDHILWNILRKGKPDERPTNEAGLALNQPTKDDLTRAAHDHEVAGWKKSASKDDMIAKLERAGVPWETYGAVSKSQPAPLYVREPIHRTSTHMAKTLRRIYLAVTDMNTQRHNPLKLYKTFGDHCSWCEFRAACEVDEEGVDPADVLDITTRPWEPFGAHLPDLEQYSDLTDLPTIHIEDI